MKEFNIMKKAIKFAGKKIFLKGSKNINFKSDFDYFTDNDLQCEKYFISVIIKKYYLMVTMILCMMIWFLLLKTKQ